MRKSIDDKVEKALRTNEQMDGRTDIADSRVASRLKRAEKVQRQKSFFFDVDGCIWSFLCRSH